VPPSLDALIAARLDLLEPEQLDVLQRASVVGLAFGRADLEELDAAARLLPSLEAQGFVRRLRRGFRFHHVLVRDVVYASLPKAERAELHERLADRLDGRGEPDELVGYHLEQASLYRDEVGLGGGRTRRLALEAGRRLGRAGLQAWKRGDASAAKNLLGRAAGLLPEDDAFALETLCELGPALRTGGDLSSAEQTLARAERAAAAAGDRRLELRAQLELAAIRLFSDPDGRAEALLDAAAEAIPVFEAVQDDRSLGRAWLAVAVVHGPIRNMFGACARAAEDALACYERSGWPSSTCQGLLAAAAYYGPMPVVEGVERCRALLERADIGGAANVLTFLAGLEAMRGRFDDARGLIEQARDTYAQLSQASAAAVNCGSLLAKIEVLDGDLAAAEAALTESCEALERAGDRAYLATRGAELADVLLGLGEVERAGLWVGRAEELAASDDVATQLVCRCVRAKLRARDGALDEAEALARDAVRLAELTDAPGHGAKARIDLAGVLRLAGRTDEAAAAVEQAIGVLDRKGNVVAAEQARTLLTELAARR
jgi:tetratricopeptide (TPR) repeat protein